MKASYEKSEEPIVISKALLDLLLKQDKPSDVIALYIFYYYTAKWQKTNQVKSTTGYTAQGMKWTEKRVRLTKKTLLRLGLIEDKVGQNQQGLVVGHYVKVNFIRSKNHTVEKSPSEEPTTPTKNHSVDNRRPNALSDDKENALSSGKCRERKDKKKEKLSTFLSKFPMPFRKHREFRRVWYDFVQFRHQKKKTLTQLGATRIINKVKNLPVDDVVKTINRSIENSWTGLFPENGRSDDDWAPSDSEPSRNEKIAFYHGAGGAAAE